MKYVKVTVIASIILFCVAIALVLMWWRSAPAPFDEASIDKDSITLKANVTIRELCSSKVGDDSVCTKVKYKNEDAEWSYYDSADGGVGEYTQNIDDLTFKVFISEDNRVIDAAILRGTTAL